MTNLSFPTVPLKHIENQGLKPDGAETPPLVLVVDDERSIADTLVLILRRAGCAALAAYDGSSALEMARVAPPDVVVSDVNMRGMTGTQLAQRLRTEVPKCTVLLFTRHALMDESERTRFRSDSKVKILPKPTEPGDFLHEVLSAAVQPRP